MEKNRPLYIFKFLWDNTDEEHPATIASITEYLSSLGITAKRQTISEDVKSLQDCGFDVVCNKGHSNSYFIGNRYLEIPELKLMVDAVQAAKFISQKKTLELIDRLSTLASPYQASELKRRLYVDGKAKTTNEAILYIVDLLHHAINHKTAVELQYIEYTSDKKKILKHDGQVYVFSPYDLVWSNDCYYVFGWDESHDKVIKFRVDRMFKPKLSDKSYHTAPEDYNISELCNQLFLMFGGQATEVKLRCDNDIMKMIVDRFGEDVQTERYGCGCFSATVKVSPGSTFYAWVFNYAGKIKIISPDFVVSEYRKRLEKASDNT